MSDVTKQLLADLWSAGYTRVAITSNDIFAAPYNHDSSALWDALKRHRVYWGCGIGGAKITHWGASFGHKGYDRRPCIQHQLPSNHNLDCGLHVRPSGNPK